MGVFIVTIDKRDEAVYVYNSRRVIAYRCIKNNEMTGIEFLLHMLFDQSNKR